MLAGIDQQEAAGPIGSLHLPGPDTPLPHQCGLLIAGDAADRDRPAQQFRLGDKKVQGQQKEVVMFGMFAIQRLHLVNV